MIKAPKNNKLRVITVGDVHGFDTWKVPLNYFRPDEEETNLHLYDYIVFVGDYVDEWDMNDAQIYKNLVEIIELKKKYPEKVILLLGNHDIHYIYKDGNKCTGFRESMYMQLNQLFTENQKLFQLAFQYKNYLWTHAGLHKGWWKFQVEDQKFVIRDGEKLEWLEIDKTGNVADILNFCYEARHQPIFDCGWARGGRQKVGGPLWADKNETYKKPLEGYHQIVGHTRIKEIKHYDNYKGDTSMTYVDCMHIEYNNYYTIEV
ncbi:MAG: metallophosphoesterase [Candidatus Muirbacterium halophilum]|nr:metallophosphoesterase [Candidatus Muirbacterium halophilum]